MVEKSIKLLTFLFVYRIIDTMKEGIMMNYYYFYGITMKTSGGKTLYLKCSSKETTDPYKILMDWSFDKEATCLWESYDDCEKFAKSYFKNFSNYSINLFGINGSLRTVNMGVAI